MARTATEVVDGALVGDVDDPRFERSGRVVPVPAAPHLQEDLLEHVLRVVAPDEASQVRPEDALGAIARAGQIVSNQTFEPILVFGIVGAIYFALCWPLSLYSARLEAKFAAATR